MHPEASDIIRRLQLEPHPEGGYFRQTFRSDLVVTPGDGRGPRAALTLIYFLLTGDDRSRWHRVASDEAWHWYQGDPLELFVAPADGGAIRSSRLGPLAADTHPQRIVAVGHWQAARTCGAWTLVGCSVAPGFELSDFTLLSTLPARARPRLEPASLATALL